jgi:hypothetical protein
VSETIDTVNTLEYPYTRTTGPYVGPFLTALRDGKYIQTHRTVREVWEAAFRTCDIGSETGGDKLYNRV